MKTILFVHDRQGAAADTQQFLEQSGHEVIAVTNGDAALKSLERDLPSLVLADVLIEGMTGFDLVKRIRRQFKAADLPIILCSAIYRSRHFREEALTLGAQEYVLKPVKYEDLVARIGELAVVRTCSIFQKPLTVG